MIQGVREEKCLPTSFLLRAITNVNTVDEESLVRETGQGGQTTIWPYHRIVWERFGEIRTTVTSSTYSLEILGLEHRQGWGILIVLVGSRTFPYELYIDTSQCAALHRKLTKPLSYYYRPFWRRHVSSNEDELFGVQLCCY